MQYYNCLVCGHDLDNSPIIDLGLHGLADSFPNSYDASEILAPLVVSMCHNCKMIQTRYRTDPVIRYDNKDIPYSYTSSNSQFSRAYWQSVAQGIATQYPKTTRILEIGSNDGYLLKCLMELGFTNVCGIDASPKMVELARASGVECSQGIFNEELVCQDDGKQYDLIMAFNCFNHSDNPRSFLRGIKSVLAEHGTFLFESPYWKSTVDNNSWDQIYHEHIFYPTVRNTVIMLQYEDMMITHAQISPYHGGSLQVYAKAGSYTKTSPYIMKMGFDEEYVHDVEKQQQWAANIRLNRDLFLERFYRAKNFPKTVLATPETKTQGAIWEYGDERPIVFGIGAAAKANTLLTYYGLNRNDINFICDASPQKIGKFTPLTRIPIVADEHLETLDWSKQIYCIMLAWNLEGLQKKMQEKYPKLQFLNPYQRDTK